MFQRGNGYVVALTYGPHSEWVRNIISAGECVLEVRGERIAATEPRVIEGQEGLQELPAVLHPVLRRLDVQHYLYLKPETR